MLQHQSEILCSTLVKEALTPQITVEHSDSLCEASGLGFFLADTGENLKFSHDGENDGFISRFIALPEHKKGFVVMVNNEDAFGLIDEITHSITDIYKIPGFEIIEKSAINTIDIKQFKEFCGTYQYQDDELTISQHDHKLFVSFASTKKMQLHKETNDLFFVQEISDVLKLTELGDGLYQVSIINNGNETIYTKIINPFRKAHSPHDKL